MKKPLQEYSKAQRQAALWRAATELLTLVRAGALVAYDMDGTPIAADRITTVTDLLGTKILRADMHRIWPADEPPLIEVPLRHTAGTA